MWGQLAGRVADSVKDVDMRRAMSRVVDVVAPEVEEDEEEYEDERPQRRGLIGLLSRVIPQEEVEYEDVYEEVYEEDELDSEADEGEFIAQSFHTPTGDINGDNWLEQPVKQEQPSSNLEDRKLTVPDKVDDLDRNRDEWVPKREEPVKTEQLITLQSNQLSSEAERPYPAKFTKQKIEIPNRSTLFKKTSSINNAPSTKLIIPTSPGRKGTSVLVGTKSVPTKIPSPPLVVDRKISKTKDSSLEAEYTAISPVVPIPSVAKESSALSHHQTQPTLVPDNKTPPSPLIKKGEPIPSDASSPLAPNTTTFSSPVIQIKTMEEHSPLRQESPLMKKKAIAEMASTVLQFPTMEPTDLEVESSSNITRPNENEVESIAEVNSVRLQPTSSGIENNEFDGKQLSIVPVLDQPKTTIVENNEPTYSEGQLIPDAPHQSDVIKVPHPAPKPCIITVPDVKPIIPETAVAATAPAPHVVTETKTASEQEPTPLSFAVTESTLPYSDVPAVDYAAAKKVADLERRCKALESQLENAEQHIVSMQLDSAKRMDEDEQWRQELLLKVKQDEIQSMETRAGAVSQENQLQMTILREKLESENALLKEQLEEDNAMKNLQLMKLQRQLDEAESKARAAASEMQKALTIQNASSTQLQQRQQQAVRLVEDKLAHTLALLDDKGEEVENLKTVIKDLRATVMKNQEGMHSTEKELEELRKENEILHHNIVVTEEEQEELQKQLEHFEGQQERHSKLQIELHMLKESKDRELAKSLSTVADVTSHKSTLEMERNAALSRARDLDQQLTVALADVEVARSDTQRAMTSNANLQRALESFQNEREAELAMLEDLKHRDEEATAAAHAAALQATHEANETKIREVKYAAEAAIKNITAELAVVKGKLQESAIDNLHLRRSLDEAIHRLQSTQEDVVDRTMMKNILLDWFAKTGKNKKQILELMASLLHFTDSEKEKCNLYEGVGNYEKFVGAVVAPLPAPAREVDTLEGENVREKWVNFLLAETDDAP